MQGVDMKEYLNKLDEPITRQDKYLYQINKKLDVLIDLLIIMSVNKEAVNKEIVNKEEINKEKIDKPIIKKRVNKKNKEV